MLSLILPRVAAVIQCRMPAAAVVISPDIADDAPSDYVVGGVCGAVDPFVFQGGEERLSLAMAPTLSGSSQLNVVRLA